MQRVLSLLIFCFCIIGFNPSAISQEREDSREVEFDFRSTEQRSASAAAQSDFTNMGFDFGDIDTGLQGFDLGTGNGTDFGASGLDNLRDFEFNPNGLDNIGGTDRSREVEGFFDNEYDEDLTDFVGGVNGLEDDPFATSGFDQPQPTSQCRVETVQTERERVSVVM